MLVDNENRACLVDFDLENTLNYAIADTRLGEEQEYDLQQGTYLAPELLGQKSLQERWSVPKVPVDVHSFGVLIYEVLSRILYFTVAQAQHSDRCFLGNCPFTCSTAKWSSFHDPHGR